MRLLLCVLLAALFPAVGIAAQPSRAFTPSMLNTAQQLMQQAAMDNIGYEIVQSLTTEVGPRLAGTEAEGRARQWAVKKLTDLGFENVREEPFEVPLWERGVERAEIIAPFPQSLTIAALGGSASTGVAGVEAEVVAFESLAELAKSNADIVGGKIVFVNEVMARSRDGSGYFKAVLKRKKAAFAARDHGAKAVLIRSVGTSSHRFAHTGQMRRIDYVSSNGVPAAALSAPDADQLQRALAYGEPVTIKLVLTPEVRPPAPSGNVVAEIVGREAPQEIVLVGAHLDSWDLGTGAIDDGAGVGIVVAAAKLLMEHLPQKPRRTIRVVLFGSEEVGVVGAEAYAKQHAGEIDQHIIATESDFGSGDIWQFETRFAEDKLPLGEAIAAVLEPLGIAPGENKAFGGPDIKYLREAGVPVVTLRQDGTDYFDLHHTANDTLDKIAPNALDQNIAAYAAFLYLAAETEAYFN
ncbi:MAG: carboxypeptidase Q [Halioglobus sp.]|jgi:carboxypeptidase Q